MSNRRVAEACDPNCAHCAVSKLMLARQPITFQDICAIGQVIADMIASIPERSRADVGLLVKEEVDDMLDEVIAGTWGQRHG